RHRDARVEPVEVRSRRGAGAEARGGGCRRLVTEAALTRGGGLALTDEQQDFVRSVRDFCAKEFPPERLREITDGYRDLHSDEIARRMAELGWYGLTIGEEYGGSGGSFLGAVL